MKLNDEKSNKFGDFAFSIRFASFFYEIYGFAVALPYSIPFDDIVFITTFLLKLKQSTTIVIIVAYTFVYYILFITTRPKIITLTVCRSMLFCDAYATTTTYSIFVFIIIW